MHDFMVGHGHSVVPAEVITIFQEDITASSHFRLSDTSIGCWNQDNKVNQEDFWTDSTFFKQCEGILLWSLSWNDP